MPPSKEGGGRLHVLTDGIELTYQGQMSGGRNASGADGDQRRTAERIRLDYVAYGLTPRLVLQGAMTLSTFWLVFLYRLSHSLHCRRVPLLPGVLRAAGLILYGADIAPGALIGAPLRIAHSPGIVVGSSAVLGDNCEIFQNVTVGGRDRMTNRHEMPVIGNNVTLFSGAVVIGPIVIGDGSSVGANGVVISDVPELSVVAGVPAVAIKRVEVPHAIRSLAKHQQLGSSGS